MRNRWVLFFVLIFFFCPVLGFSQAPPVERGISVTVTVPGEVPQPPGGGGGGAPTLPTATVIFEGKAYPDAFVTILRDKTVSATVKADLKGDFSKTLTAVPAGIWNFGVFAEDTEGRKSVTISFSTNIIGGTTMKISGIFLSPTISPPPA